ncbi:MAG: NAD(P)/FAD-dependent oxidoreductase [Candidatus Altiarchaeota archaeon]|nr:NAD(P)/FAD-dependent oxidoreductase [Candidatus Altiarchaeota archaeon]
MTDILIVGAGPAGSSFAKFAAEKGFSVIIIDSGDTSTLWNKPCGNGLVERAIENTGLRPPSGKELYIKTDFVKLSPPAYNFQIKLLGGIYVINRNEFGKRILGEATSAGARFLKKTTFTKVIIENGRVVGIKARHDRKMIELRARLVVDASGFSSRVKSQLPKDWAVSENPKVNWLCYRGIVNVQTMGDLNSVYMYLDSELSPKGYWWYFPQGKSQANIGLGVLPENSKDLVKNYEKLKSLLPITGIVHEAGAPIPMSRPPLSLVGPGILVLGDAAPTIDPVTGEGIGPSIEAAYLAASKLKNIQEAEWTFEALWSMNEYMRDVGSQMASMDVVKEVLWQVDKDRIQKILSLFKNRKSMLKIPFNPLALKILFKMRQIRRHYQKYPKTPDGLTKWTKKLEKLYSSLSF